MRSVRSICVVYYVLMGSESVHLRVYIWTDVPLHMHVWPIKCDTARHMYKLLSVAYQNLRSPKLHIHQGVLPTQQLLKGSFRSIILPWLVSWINVPENYIMQIRLTPCKCPVLLAAVDDELVSCFNRLHESSLHTQPAYRLSYESEVA